jgi:hypothetical protein
MRHLDLLRFVTPALQDVTKLSERRIGGKNRGLIDDRPKKKITPVATSCHT